MGCINPNLLALKLLLFCFFGALGCIFPFLVHNERQLGLSVKQIQWAAVVVPLPTIVIPTLIGILVDRSGRHRAALAAFFLSATIFYSLIALIPPAARPTDRYPAVRFQCGPEGSVIDQERCSPSCGYDVEGTVHLFNCRYDCDDSPATESLLDPVSLAPSDLLTENGDGPGIEIPPPKGEDGEDETDQYGAEEEEEEKEDVPSPPHLCFVDGNKNVMCNALTNVSQSIAFNLTLATYEEKESKCSYPVVNFNARGQQYDNLTCHMKASHCTIICDLQDPYSMDSLFSTIQCAEDGSNPSRTFWTYVVLRSVADCSAATGISLLSAVILIMTHEYKADYGAQLVWGALGLGLFSPLVGTLLESEGFFGGPEVPVAALAALLMTSALLLLAVPLHPEWRARSLSPHLPRLTRSAEVGILLLVVTLLGIMWGILEPSLPSILFELNSPPLMLGLTATAAAIPVLILFWRSERVVDYCGHAHVFMLGFTVYVLRFTGSSLLVEAWNAVAVAPLHFFTLSFCWVAAALYMYHLAPRYLATTGQALVMAAHSGLGRFLGALICVFSTEWVGLKYTYRGAAAVSAFAAALYLILYHCCFPRPRPQQRQQQVAESPVKNGTYTPLRVYHNGRGKPGIRY